jgi:vancomycin resistance protein VanW
MTQLKGPKIWVKLQLRLCNDICDGTIFRFAQHSKDLELNFAIELSQEIKPSETLENKLYNINVAANKINAYTIGPGEILSFWRIVGNPESQLKHSRSITAGQVTSEIGGGICQVSGIIYHIGIMAGLTVLERHNHSIDIYDDQTRFTPLGTDATVVYGYKDLRMENNFDFPVKFSVTVVGNKLSVKLLSLKPIDKKPLIYNVSHDNSETIATVSDEHRNLISRSVYKLQSVIG